VCQHPCFNTESRARLHGVAMALYPLRLHIHDHLAHMLTTYCQGARCGHQIKGIDWKRKFQAHTCRWLTLTHGYICVNLWLECLSSKDSRRPGHTNGADSKSWWVERHTSVCGQEVLPSGATFFLSLTQSFSRNVGNESRGEAHGGRVRDVQDASPTKA